MRKWNKVLMTGMALLLTTLVGSACSSSNAPQQEAPASTQAGSQETPKEEKKVISLGVTQIVEHPALDAVRQGMLDALADQGYKENDNLKVDLQNAQGDMNNAIAIAQNFASSQKDIIVAIATPTAQAAAQATKDIPIVFAAVTDPLSAGLVSSMDKPDGNVTGTSDQLPMALQVELIQKFLPDVKKLGVIYSTSEVNSEVQVKDLESVTKEKGIELLKAGITRASEVQTGAESLAGKVDAILIPVDNTVVSAAEGVFTVAQKEGIPVFGSDTDTVKRGAIATYGIDYYKMGRQTGDIAARILAGSTVSENAVEVTKEADLIINVKAAESYGVTVSDALKQEAKEMIEQ